VHQDADELQLVEDESVSEGDGVLSVRGGDPTEVLDVLAGGAAGAAAAHVAVAAAHEALLPLTRRRPRRPRPAGL
jgi:hypothetical protein